MSPDMQDPPEDPAPQDEEDFEINEDDIEEVIEIENGNDGDVAGQLDDMELQDEGMEDAGAVAPPHDDAITVFSTHNGSVFCIEADPVQGTVAVSGGEDDKAYVWNILDGQILFECTGHKDSVTCVSFSHDGKYVATADMSGIIQVWNVSKKEAVWNFETGDLEWIQWHTAAPVLLAGTADGDIWMWKIPSGDTKTFQSHGCACNIAKLLPGGKQICAGYSDGVVKVWDLKSGTAEHTISGHNAHKDSITCMDVHKSDPLVITGSTDQTAKLINTMNGKVVATFNCSSGEEEDSVEAVGFATGLPLVATGTLSGTLTLWDISSQVARQQCKHEDGIVRLKWKDTAPVVYTCTLGGSVHEWDGRTGQEVRHFTGHQAEILDFHLTRDNNYILTGSGDGTARVFKLHL